MDVVQPSGQVVILRVRVFNYGFHRVSRQVSIAGGCPGLTVAEEPSDRPSRFGQYRSHRGPQSLWNEREQEAVMTGITKEFSYNLFVFAVIPIPLKPRDNSEIWSSIVGCAGHIELSLFESFHVNEAGTAYIRSL